MIRGRHVGKEHWVSGAYKCISRSVGRMWTWAYVWVWIRVRRGSVHDFIGSRCPGHLLRWILAATQENKGGGSPTVQTNFGQNLPIDLSGFGWTSCPSPRCLVGVRTFTSSSVWASNRTTVFTGCGGDLEWFPHQKGVYNLCSFNPLVVQLVSYYFHIERTAVRRSRTGED